MANILRVTTRWSGFSGAPGFTVMHFSVLGLGTDGGEFDDATYANAAASKVTNFFDAIKEHFPDEVTFQVEPEVELLDETNGQLITVLPAGVVPAVVGTSTGGYSAPVGAVVNWRSNAVRNGRRIRGRSFLVPLTHSSLGNDGRLQVFAQTDIQTAATALSGTAAAPFLGVWARPTTSTATDGQWAAIASTTVPTLPAVLRSRRD